MPKKRRLLNSPRNKKYMKIKAIESQLDQDGEVRSARGRLKGALMDVLEPTEEDIDYVAEQTPTKDRYDIDDFISCDEQIEEVKPRQSYVLKLFDRSVDLSQFTVDSPLYPICRAWIANQPKANYSEINSETDPIKIQDQIILPGPSGKAVSRIPNLLPEQAAGNKNNINLNYKEAPPPSREQLLGEYSSRWGRVRRAWLDQATRVEARYSDSQDILNEISANIL